MPAKSKQQQKFFGVVKAMQKGDIPKKGAAGKVAKDMSKKEVDKYASTKHKGLPKKVKKETMKLSNIKKMVDEELKYVLENLNDPTLKKLRTLAPGTKFPPLTTWWEAQPEDLMSAVYWSKGSLPPSDPAKFEKAYNDIVKQLHKMHPIPAEVLPKLDLDDETERAIMIDAPGMNEAKMTPAKVQKAQKELVATIQLLKKNFPMYKAAKESGDAKKLEKHRDIAVKLTKKKKQLELDLDKALGGLYQDAELDLKEAAPRMRKDPDSEQLMSILKDVSRIENKMKSRDRSRYSHVKRDFKKFFDSLMNLKSRLDRQGPTIPEGINEALPKFKTPAEGLKWVWSKRDEAMDMEQELKDISAEIQQLYGEMEQDAEPGGGPIADRYGRELEALENKHKDLRAEYDHVMTEIDEFDQHYIGF